MNKIIYLNAGHSLSDPGATSGSEIESKHAMAIRDALVPLLQKHFEVRAVPDDLNLVSSISWINKQAKNLDDGYAFSIHLNSNSGEAGTGAETWYCSGSLSNVHVIKVKEMAQKIIDIYCNVTGFVNRGAKPDSYSRFGRLGFVRDTNCYAGLIEACFINNSKEIEILKNNYKLIADAIYRGIIAAFGIEEEENMIVDEEKLKEIYNEILMRDPDEGASGYVGMTDVFVRNELMSSEERESIESLVSAARVL